MSTPAWKVALLERKKKQEEQAKVKQAQVEEEKLASLPAWKRAIALREKQARPTTGTTVKGSTSSIISNKWQVAVERIKGPESPIIKQKPDGKDAMSCPRPAGEVFTSATTKTIDKNQAMQRWKHSSSSSGSTAKPANTPPAITSTPPAITSTLAAITKPASTPSAITKPASTPKASTPAAITKPASTPTGSFSASSVAPPSPDDDSSLAAMPAWKRALILKKRQKLVTKEDVIIVKKQNSGEDEPDSGPPTSSNGIPSAPKTQQPEVVNRRDAEEAPTHRLVEQEGKTLRAPVYKEVDEWANVKEEEDKFRSLPLWKQALIKRRREDIAKRSGLPVPAAPPTSKADTHSPLSNHTKKAALDKATDPSSRKVKTVNEQKKTVGVRESSSIRSKGKATPTESKATDLKPVRKEPVTTKRDIKPARKAPLPPSGKDPMFTYNFSKSAHRMLDTGGTSSDSTDSELEDAVVTNLDESSDEGDSGIVLQRYSANKLSDSSPSMGQKSRSESSVSSKTIVPVLGKNRKLRRVSWSDTQLVLEHFYPKYDYSDYDEIEQDDTSKPPSTKNSGLSHRLHPSLRPSNESDPYSYGFGSTVSPRSPTHDNSLSTFVPKALSGYSQSPEILSDRNHAVVNDNSRTLEEATAEEEADDFYTDLTSNTAALLW